MYYQIPIENTFEHIEVELETIARDDSGNTEDFDLIDFDAEQLSECFEDNLFFMTPEEIEETVQIFLQENHGTIVCDIDQGYPWFSRKYIKDYSF